MTISPKVNALYFPKMPLKQLTLNILPRMWHVIKLFKVQKQNRNKVYNVIMYFQPVVYFIPDNMYYLIPAEQEPQQCVVEDKERNGPQRQEQEQEQREKKLNIYLEIFRQQITKMQKSNKKKNWSEEEDKLLLNLDPSTTDWNKLPFLIPGTNVAICKRRYYRLKQQLIKWPREVDTDISKLFEQEKLSWSEIREQINKKYCQLLGIPKLSTNKIKQRYMLYLRPGICRQQWTIEEDIEIIRVIKQYGKQWTKALKNIVLLQNRTELQLKNRYFGTLKFLEKRVERKVSAILKNRRSI